MHNKAKFILFVFLALFGLGAVFFFQYSKFNDGKLHVVFCNVGQGDSIFIRTPSGTDILWDGGPDNSVLSCLSNNMPFWDRDIELMILSHPHADHLNGLISVMERYNVLYFATERLGNNTAGFKDLMKKVESRKSRPKDDRPLAENIRNLYAGDKINLKDDVSIKILTPTKSFLEASSPNGMIYDTGEFSSLISLLSYGSFDVLLTGDSQTKELKDAISGAKTQIEVFHVPHHGSKTGLNSDLLYQITPQLALISVGRKNKYGHQSKEVLSILKEHKTRFLRTDEKGEIEIVSDGKKWWVR